MKAKLPCTILVGSALALTANAAMAANIQVHKPIQAYVGGGGYFAGVQYPPQYYASLNYNMGQIGQFLQSVANGVPMPNAELQLAHNVASWRAAHHIGGTYYFPDE